MKVWQSEGLGLDWVILALGSLWVSIGIVPHLLAMKTSNRAVVIVIIITITGITPRMLDWDTTLMWGLHLKLMKVYITMTSTVSKVLVRATKAILLRS
jgi:hypothetical protein